ncbi:hypothetical protein A3860_05110 [Niastella vici]|uniref:Carrier domain-containing protein n=1 Tax=Niastella vici TaxID=1703345 RepID=A0A1V9FRZ2_9BACT|nr:non-ribosomal peptide synthetase [Niastella vici]OQP61100.1 hypothetical protein A3860_05110 [Niastella vici]
MQNIRSLIRRLKELNIQVRLNGEDLRLYSITGHIDEGILAEVRSVRPQLVDYLKRTAGAAHIPRVPEQTDYPLSSAQRRMWILSQSAAGCAAYHVPGIFTLKGQVDIHVLGRAFGSLIERHEILRTVFREGDDGEVRQVILPVLSTAFSISREDVRKLNDKENYVRQQIQQWLARPFDLSHGPLLRACIYHMEDDEWLLCCSMHHIVTDGWSKGIMIKEVLQLYHAGMNGIEPSLPLLPIQYKDYANWQHRLLEEGTAAANRKYWIDRLSDGVPVIELPADQVRPAVKTYNGGMIRKILGTSGTATLVRLCGEERATLFMGLLSVVHLLLYRCTGQQDLVVGTPVAGRDHTDLESQIGFYVNTLALRNQCNGTDTFRALLKKVQLNTLEAYAHQRYPFDRLVDDLSLRRDASRNPLFDVMVILQNYEEFKDKALSDALPFNVQEYESGEHVVSKFDLTFIFREKDGQICLNLEYNSDIFSREAADRLLNHFLALFGAITDEPEKAVGLHNILNDDQQQWILAAAHSEIPERRKHKTIIELFEEQAARSPDAIAVSFLGRTLNYRELNEKANRLGDYLRKNYQVKAEDIVGICLERSEWMIVAILGVLKSGGAYLPIDVEYPEDRIGYMLSDSGCSILLDEKEMEKFKKAEDEYEKNDLPPVNIPAHLAYIIYTSGTTGNPKGSQLEHRNVVSLLVNGEPLFSFSEEDVWTMFHTYCFDVSVWEMYGALLYGGRLVIVPSATAKDPKAYRELIRKEGATILNQTPSSFYRLIDEDLEHSDVLSSLRYIMLAGEALHPARLQRWWEKNPSPKLINMYGITETTVFATYKTVGEKEIIANSSSIGYPMPSFSCYVLDEWMGLAPVGVAGELYIGGAGVGRGYLNKEALTRQRFIEDPFAPGSGGRLYRSGDKVKLLASGEVEYLGRIDEQVKIRGHRVEPGEIENALMRHPAVSAAAVLTVQDSAGENELVAYMVIDQQADAPDLTATQLSAYINESLPTFMVPARYIKVDELPLTLNGKTDKRKLLRLNGQPVGTGIAYEAPRNEIERRLAAVWQSVLGLEKLGVRDNFFDLGGNSMKIIEAARLASTALRRQIDVTLVFQYPTILSLAGHLAGTTDRPAVDDLDREALLADLAKFS